MHLYIDEDSLTGSHTTPSSAEAALTQFVGMVLAVQDARQARSATTWRTAQLQVRQLTANVPLVATLNQTANAEIATAFRTVLFDRENPRCWSDGPLHCPDEGWSLDGVDIGGTSRAEAGARDRVPEPACLLAFLPGDASAVPSQIEVACAASDSTHALSVHAHHDQLLAWLLAHAPKQDTYVPGSDTRPTVDQTCLADDTRFVRDRTWKARGSEPVYRHLTSGRLFHRDTQHTDTAGGAHLEVYDNRGGPLGTCPIDDPEAVTAYAEPSKRTRLKRT